MSTLSINTMRKLVNAVDQNNIPETFIKLFKIESESDIETLVKEYNGLKEKTDDSKSDQIDSEIKAWASGV